MPQHLLLSHILKQTHRLNLNKRSHEFIPRSYARILKETPFRLKTFRNDMLDLEPTLHFLALQSDITTWHQLNASRCYLDPKLLPLLSDIAIPLWLLPTYYSRDITRLHTAIRSDDLDDRLILNTLAGYGRKLSVLVLEREVLEGCNLNLGDFVACLAKNLPLIQNLCLWHSGELVSYLSHDVVLLVYPYLSGN